MKNTGYFLVKDYDETIVKVVMGVKIRKPEKHISKTFPKYKSFEMVSQENFWKVENGLFVVL